MSIQLGAPQPLLPAHRFDEFECGELALDEWLKRRAHANQLSGASRTFVVVDQDQRIRGYYAMAAGAAIRPIRHCERSEAIQVVGFNHGLPRPSASQ